MHEIPQKKNGQTTAANGFAALQNAAHNHTSAAVLLQALIENSFDLLALIDEKGNYLYVSESVYKTLNYPSDVLLGYEAKDLLGKNCFAYMHPDDLPRLKEQFETLFTGAKKLVVPPYRFLDATGNWRWIEAIVTNQLHHPGIRAIVVSCRDVTEIRNAQQKQLDTERLLQALIENSFDMVGLLDENGRYKFVSDAVRQVYEDKSGSLLGLKSSDLLGSNSFDLIHPDDLPRVQREFQTLFNGEKKIQVKPYRIRSAAGRWLWLEAIVANQLNNPALQAIVVSARNITQQVEAEEKVKEMQLMEALIEGEEKERSRIARDLHDGVSGMIAAAKMQFDALAEKQHHFSAQKEYAQGMQLLESAAKLVRSTSHSLMPEVLLENGLNNALQHYCRTISNDRLTVAYIVLGNIQHHSANFDLSLYRIAQELLNNAIKHSGASEVLVQVSERQNRLSLTVEDNGNGFQPDLHAKGTGLRSIEKRVAAMNGKMDLQTVPGKGTSVYLEFVL